MYIPYKHRIDDFAEIRDFLLKNSFGSLISLVDNRITGTHVPFHLTENEAGEWLFQTHIAKANPQWKGITDQAEVMLIFQGAHAYVSSQWYSQENAPTWNYQAIHLYGQARLMTEAELAEMLTYLMQTYEQALPTPLRYEDLSEKLRESHLKAILGIEIKITEIQAKYKLSQNRNELDYQNIIKELEDTTDLLAHGVAQEMKRIKL